MPAVFAWLVVVLGYLRVTLQVWPGPGAALPQTTGLVSVVFWGASSTMPPEGSLAANESPRPGELADVALQERLHAFTPSRPASRLRPSRFHDLALGRT